MFTLTSMFSLLCFAVYGVCSYARCRTNANVFLLEGQLVKVSRFSSESLAIIGCWPDSRLKHVKVFDTAEELRDVIRLKLSDITWPSLPNDCKVQHVSMGNIAPRSPWGGCSRLNELSIDYIINSSLIPPNWLTNCSRLHTVTLYNMNLTAVHAILDSIPAVHRLTINVIEDIVHVARMPLFTSSDKYQSMVEVKLLNYRVTEGLSIEAAKAANTTWSDVSTALTYQLSLLPQLQNLTIRIMYFDMCPPVSSSHAVTFRSLRRLEINPSNTSRLCFKKFRALPRLRHLGLNPTIGLGNLDLQIGELISIRAPVVKVFLDFTHISSFRFTREDYLMISDTTESRRGYVEINSGSHLPSVDCDCDHSLWLARAMRERLFSASGLVCFDGLKPREHTCEWLDCLRVHCDGGCVCCQDSEQMFADCRDANLTHLPENLMQMTNVTRLLARNNRITTLPKYIPLTMQMLDLSRNGVLQWMTAEEIFALLAVSTRQVRLSGNPVDCSCDTKPLLDALQKHSKQIEDYQNITCMNTTRVAELNTSTLCAARDREAALMTIASAVVVVAVIVLEFGAAMYYRRSIQIFLFARGWCLCWLREEELDADRHFDVFLSFCHEDAELVLESMLPQLDRNYKVCVHLRDWNPGAMIPSQITVSVESSRRTLVVLSKSFVTSLWGLLEFQTAYASGISEGRNRVVMVILDDVLETSELPGELRAYVSFNTYVKWGDPWFWDKLQYALPHRLAQVHCEPAPAHPQQPTPNDQEVELRAVQVGNTVTDLNVTE